MGTKRALKMLLLMATMAAMAVACDDGDSDDTDASVNRDSGTQRTDGGPRPDSGSGDRTIVDVASSNPDFSLLVAAVTRAGLADELSADGPLTVFAPTNAAFAASGIDMNAINTLPVEQLSEILLYHVLGDEVTSSEVQAGVATTAADLSIILGTTGGVTINGGNAVTGGANVTTADVDADNGVIHVIDRVLLPPDVVDLARYAGLTTLATVVTDAGLVQTLEGEGPFTVFAPTNAAFAALPAVPSGEALEQVLLYHVVAGAAVPSSGVPAQANSAATNEWDNNLTLLFDTSSGVRVNGVEVVIADVKATNGIVHVIGQVLLPLNVATAASAAGLTELLDAVGAAAPLPGGTTVAQALSSPAPYTVFAPTNAAFEAIASTVAGLTPAQVRDVLLFHVLSTSTFPSPVLAADLPAPPGANVPTLNGASAALNTSVTPPTIDGARIIRTDINVTNGVVHVIDAVMVP